MTSRLVVEFTKMNGAGNDFIVIDDRFYHFSNEELRRIALRECARRTGIGADGLLVLSDSPEAGVDFRMRYLNADGSVGSMCGNGARCIARYARSAGFESEPMVFSTDAGLYRASVPSEGEGEVRLFLPPHADYRPCSVHGLADQLYYVWTGTEHAVLFVDGVDGAPVSIQGPQLRHAPEVSSTGANVNFVECVAPDRIKVRTYEKGVEGETLACGTGATASALVARLAGRLAADRVFVDMPGGILTVGLKDKDVRPEYLEGPAVAVFRGTFSL